MLERVLPIASPAAGLSSRRLETLLQFHAWPDRFATMASDVVEACGALTAPSPGRAVQGKDCALLRVHPQRLWLVSDQLPPAPTLLPETGAVLDLSHARTVIRIAGANAEPLLSRFVTVDLRPEHFAIDQLAITPLHRVSVVLWRRADGIDILAPRSFAASLWDLLGEAAERL